MKRLPMCFAACSPRNAGFRFSIIAATPSTASVLLAIRALYSNSTAVAAWLATRGAARAEARAAWDRERCIRGDQFCRPPPTLCQADRSKNVLKANGSSPHQPSARRVHQPAALPLWPSGARRRGEHGLPRTDRTRLCSIGPASTWSTPGGSGAGGSLGVGTEAGELLVERSLEVDGARLLPAPADGLGLEPAAHPCPVVEIDGPDLR